MKSRKPFNLYVPDAKMFEYVIAIPCPDNLDQYIREQQVLLRKKLKANWPARVIPQIALVCFDQQEYSEEKILGRLEKSANEIEPFLATMKKLAGDECEEIFIQIGSEGAIHKLLQSIKKHCHQLMVSNMKGLPYYNKRHEMRIFGGLSKKEFSQVTKYLLNELDLTPFIVNELELSRREKGSEKFESVKRFELNWDLQVEIKDISQLCLTKL